MIGDILRLTEGSLAPVACLDFPVNDCPRQEECLTLPLWEKLHEAVKGVVDQYTLADIFEWQSQRGENYYI